jgi:biopolymer transport protein ExbD
MLIDGEEVSRETFVTRLASKVKARKDGEVHFKIDQRVRQVDAVAAMSLAGEAGTTRYKLVTSR